MAGITSELIEKARKAENPEHLVVLARENGIEMTEEEAKMQFANLHPQQGELSDEELDNVAGGACHTGGYTVVSCGKKCFTGKFEKVIGTQPSGELYPKRRDNWGKRELWKNFCFIGEYCGRCIHLEFDGDTGYCGVSK